MRLRSLPQLKPYPQYQDIYLLSQGRGCVLIVPPEFCHSVDVSSLTLPPMIRLFIPCLDVKGLPSQYGRACAVKRACPLRFIFVGLAVIPCFQISTVSSPEEGRRHVAMGATKEAMTATVVKKARRPKKLSLNPFIVCRLVVAILVCCRFL